MLDVLKDSSVVSITVFSYGNVTFNFTIANVSLSFCLL